METATTNLANALAARGVDVTVATSTPAGAQGYPRCAMVHAPTRRELRDLFRSADIIHLQGFATVPTMVALASGRPVLWDHHDFDLICPKSTAWWGGWCTYGPVKCTLDLRRDHPQSSVFGLQGTLALRRTLQRHPRVHHVVHSQFVLEKNGPSGAAVIPYGIPSTLIREPRATAALRVIATGRLIAEKGFDVLLDALATPALRELGVRATIVGSGDEGDALVEHAKRVCVEDRVQFTGRLHGAALDATFEDTLAVIVPSLWDEPFGIVALEGMARGIPVIVTRVGGLSALGEAGGVVVPRSDPDSLAAAIRALAEDPSHRARVVARGAALARSSTWDLLSERYLGAYRDAISRAEPARP